MMGLGRKGQKHPARTPKPQLSLARGYTHIHTARALSLAHEVCLSQKRSGKYMQHTHACTRTCERVKRGTRRREGCVRVRERKRTGNACALSIGWMRSLCPALPADGLRRFQLKTRGSISTDDSSQKHAGE